MIERAFFAMAGLSVLLTSCAQMPALTPGETEDALDPSGVDDTKKSVPGSDNQVPGAAAPPHGGEGRTSAASDASGRTASSSGAQGDGGQGKQNVDASGEVPVGADASGAGGGAGGGAGSGAGNGASVVGVARTPAGAGSCNVPGEAHLEDVSHPTTVIGNGSAGSCTSSAFVEAVAKGGVITFNCGPNPVTIQLQQTAKVMNATRKVVIDGGGKVALSGGGQRRILYQSTCDASLGGYATAQCDNQAFPELTVQNLTFVDGDARGSGEGDGGGAIYATGGRLKIVNSHFFNNHCVDTGADAGGGAVRALQQYNNQPVYIVNSVFGGSAGRGNVGSNGGALSAIGVNYFLIGSTLTYNQAVGRGANPAKAGTPGGGSGGAIYLDGTNFNLQVCGSEIAHNQANEHGGGIFFVSNDRSGWMRIESSTMTDNAGGAFENFPGMYVEANGNPNISNSQVH